MQVHLQGRKLDWKVLDSHLIHLDHIVYGSLTTVTLHQQAQLLQSLPMQISGDGVPHSYLDGLRLWLAA